MLQGTLKNEFVPPMRRKAIGPVCCVMHEKETSAKRELVRPSVSGLIGCILKHRVSV